MKKWDSVREGFIDLYTSAAQHTETWARVGVGHYDRYGLVRRLEKELALLGSEVHRLMKEREQPDLASDPGVRAARERISALEDQLRAKDEEIQAIRRSSDEEDPGHEATAGA